MNVSVEQQLKKPEILWSNISRVCQAKTLGLIFSTVLPSEQYDIKYCFEKAELEF